MNKEIDLIGTNAVCNFIRQSHMAYFYIHRYPSQSGTLPIYEYKRGRSSNEAATDFLEWSNIMNSEEKNFVQYQITITNVLDGDESDVKRKRVEKLRASFVLNSRTNIDEERPTGKNYHNQNGFSGFNQNYYEERFSEIETRLKLEMENRELKRTIKELEEELDEEEEEEVQDSTTLGMLNKLFDKIDGKTKKTKEAVLSGPDKEAFIKSLNESIKILIKHDPDLDIHLKKLATVAQTKPAKFKMILELMETHL